MPAFAFNYTMQRSVYVEPANQPGSERVAVLQSGTQGANFFHIASPAIGRPAP